MFKFFLRTFVQSETHSLHSLQHNLTKLDYKVIIVCIVVALSLTFSRYLSDYSYLVLILHDLNFTQVAKGIEQFMTIHENHQLNQLVYWAIAILFFYFIFPSIVIIFCFKEKLTDYGLGFQGVLKHYKLYLVMLAIMLPLIIIFSGTESFLAHYPFYEVKDGESLFPNFVIWELFYFLQFFALEFLFRGFILHGTKQRFGFYAIFVMMIPYCMIHFGKPIIESIAAIIAGVVLGVMSLKSKTIWPGVALHCSVALTMDLSALAHKKGVFSQDDQLLESQDMIN